jgi:hypothetical protein
VNDTVEREIVSDQGVQVVADARMIELKPGRLLSAHSAYRLRPVEACGGG